MSGGLHAATVRILITGIAVFLAVATVPGIEADSFVAGLAAVLVLTILNLIIRPILFVLTLPLIVLSLGLFLVVLNALLLEFTAYLVKGFTVSGFWPAVGGALVISIVTTILNLFAADRRQVDIRTDEPRQPKIINPPE
ncbi:MAG TPA: phage holin family protein, partial [Nitrospira sp.]|nr:phage holin family protein [Nitrospira sp.]